MTCGKANDALAIGNSAVGEPARARKATGFPSPSPNGDFPVMGRAHVRLAEWLPART
jgi:hypothetical protein